MKFLIIPSEFLNHYIAVLTHGRDKLGATWCIEIKDLDEQETVEMGICAVILGPEPAHSLAILVQVGS